MSDDLVQQLRVVPPWTTGPYPNLLLAQAADRIEALEARNRAQEEALRQIKHLATVATLENAMFDVETIRLIAREALDA